MRIHNVSRIPTEDLVLPLEHGAHGFDDAGVFVYVADHGSQRGRYWGRAHHPNGTRQFLKRIGSTSKATELVEIMVPKEGRTPTIWNPQGVKGIQRRWPQGFPVESMDDYLVALMAHEVRHISQYRTRAKARQERRKVPVRRELDAELWALNRLNRYREMTNRERIEPLVGPKPFGPKPPRMLVVCERIDDGCRVFRCSTRVINSGWTLVRSRARVFDPTADDQWAVAHAFASIPDGCHLARSVILDQTPLEAAS